MANVNQYGNQINNLEYYNYTNWYQHKLQRYDVTQNYGTNYDFDWSNSNAAGVLNPYFHQMNGDYYSSSAQHRFGYNGYPQQNGAYPAMTSSNSHAQRMMTSPISHAQAAMTSQISHVQAAMTSPISPAQAAMTSQISPAQAAMTSQTRPTTQPATSLIRNYVIQNEQSLQATQPSSPYFRDDVFQNIGKVLLNSFLVKVVQQGDESKTVYFGGCS